MSPKSGETFNLASALDFRPLIKESDGTTANPTITRATDDLTTNLVLVPDTDSTTLVNYQYYLPRIDKIVLTRDRQFEVIKGVADVNPVAPPDDDDSMTLYTMSIPAYTYALTDIETRYIDNKRFTMRDIGKLEKRIERLEYYTSLNFVEKETGRKVSQVIQPKIHYSIFGERFKNGILVDPLGHSVGDVSLERDYRRVHFEKTTQSFLL